MIRDDAALGLGYLQLRPELAIPALINHLPSALADTRRFEAVDTIGSIARFGTNASQALPALMLSLDHGDENVRREATNAIRRVDPTAASRLGWESTVYDGLGPSPPVD
jgi:HEAT repeat protein